MDLFSNTAHPNLLPYDGEVIYYPNVFSTAVSQEYLEILLKTVEWQQEVVNMFGKTITMDRKIALYGDTNFVYGYAKNKRQAKPWPKELSALKTSIENKCNTHFNACLLNLYHNGTEAMGWHADDEKELGENPTIASVSFGADRKFSFKHKTTKQTLSLTLQKGSLLVMKGTTQTHWLHKLPPINALKTPRINLTFRNIIS